jgi:hypothetical protein
MRGHQRDQKTKWWFRPRVLTGRLLRDRSANNGGSPNCQPSEGQMVSARAQAAKTEAEARRLDAQTKKLEVETRRAEVETEKLAADAEQLPSQARKIGLENRHLEIGLLGKLILLGVALGVLVAALVLAIVDPSRLTDVGEEALKSMSWLVPK